jgi:hypothetical protein
MKQHLPIIFAAFLAAACSTNVETRISNNGVTAPQPRQYMISTSAETSSELRTAYLLVTKNMTQKGFAIAKEAPLHLEITLDARDAMLALGSTAGPGSLSSAKSKKPLQSCQDKEYRLGITLTQVADGFEVYKSRAAEYHCKMPIAEALPALVDAALVDFGKPRGNYVVERKAKD